MIVSQVQIERRFARSARIDADLKGSPPLVGYVLQASVERALASMAASQIEMGQGAFTWTGPYGGGKSSAALLVGNLVGGTTEGRRLAKTIAGPQLSKLFAKAFPEGEKQWSVVPITGRRVDLRGAIVEAAAKALSWRSDVADVAKSSNEGLVQCLIQSARKGRGGILLLLDELGKFLEHAVSHNGDIHLLQELAEHSARSNGRFVIIGILHQAFDQYADRAARDARREWAKVQGRYQDISFVAGVDETVALLGRAIVTEHRPQSAAQLAQAAAAAVGKRRPVDLPILAEALTATWPLNPITALLLGPVSRQRFAQNERSVFGFLSSAEPFGLQEYLGLCGGSPTYTYNPEQLWDYLVANFGLALATGSGGSRFSLASEAIDRAAAKGTSVHVSLAKSAALIELFRNGSGVTVAADFLEVSLPLCPSKEIRKAIKDLLEWAVFIDQPRLGGYGIFAGSDFDLQKALDKARATPTAQELHVLPQKVGLGFSVAKHHYFRTGALRAFNVLLHPWREDQSSDSVAKEIAGGLSKGGGALVVALSESPLKPQEAEKRARGLALALNSQGVVAAVTLTPTPSLLQSETGELAALDRVMKEHPQLQGDRIARREITGRVSATIDVIQRALREILDASSWWIASAEPTRIDNTLSVVATQLADATFHAAPLLKSELVQRDRLSSNAAAAVRDLAHAMVTHGAEKALGFSGFPPEMGLYLTVLQPFGLHREAASGGYQFSGPDRTKIGQSLKPAWSVMDSADELSLAEIFKVWEAAPFGIKRGVMPILALANVLSRRDRIAVYVNGIFQASFDTYFVDRLLQSPSDVRIRRADRSTKEAGFLHALGAVLGVESASSALPVAQALFQRYAALPAYAKRTDTISERAKAIRRAVLKSNDPEKLLFEALGEVTLGGDLATIVYQALNEVEVCFPNLKDELRNALANSVGADPTSFGGIKERIQSVAGLTNDLRFEAFSSRIAAFEDGVGDIEGLASLLVHKPVQTWSDRDCEQAYIELARLGRRLRELEALAIVRSRGSKTEAVALIVGMDPKVPPVVTSFELTDGEKLRAGRLARELLATLNQKGVRSSLQLAALARAVAALAASSELESTT